MRLLRIYEHGLVFDADTPVFVKPQSRDAYFLVGAPEEGLLGFADFDRAFALNGLPRGRYEYYFEVAGEMRRIGCEPFETTFYAEGTARQKSFYKLKSGELLSYYPKLSPVKATGVGDAGLVLTEPVTVFLKPQSKDTYFLVGVAENCVLGFSDLDRAFAANNLPSGRYEYYFEVDGEMRRIGCEPFETTFYAEGTARQKSFYRRKSGDFLSYYPKLCPVKAVGVNDAGLVLTEPVAVYVKSQSEDGYFLAGVAEGCVLAFGDLDRAFESNGLSRGRYEYYFEVDGEMRRIGCEPFETTYHALDTHEQKSFFCTKHNQLLTWYPAIPKFRFSILMPVYNVEEYVAEAIESVVEQTFAFDRVQLVLINDGSSDSSGQICQSWQARFPENIVYIEKPNGGPASARNVGLDAVEGEWLGFLDSDDCLSPNALESISAALDQYGAYCDVVRLPMDMFGRLVRQAKPTATELYSLMDAAKYQEPFQGMGGVFLNSSVAKLVRFNENLHVVEDTLYVNEVILHTNLNVLSVGDARYLYRKRFAEDSITDDFLRTNTHANQDHAVERMRGFQRLLKLAAERFGTIPRYFKFCVLQKCYVAEQHLGALPVDADFIKVVSAEMDKIYSLVGDDCDLYRLPYFKNMPETRINWLEAQYAGARIVFDKIFSNNGDRCLFRPTSISTTLRDVQVFEKYVEYAISVDIPSIALDFFKTFTLCLSVNGKLFSPTKAGDVEIQNGPVFQSLLSPAVRRMEFAFKVSKGQFRLNMVGKGNMVEVIGFIGDFKRKLALGGQEVNKRLKLGACECFIGEFGPLLTVIITTFNRPNYLKELLASISKQSNKHLLRVVIMDDSSDADSSVDDAILALNESGLNVVVSRQPHNGAPLNRKLAFDNVETKYVTWIDDDDLLNYDDFYTEALTALEMDESLSCYAYKECTFVENSAVVEKVVAQEVFTYKALHNWRELLGRPLTRPVNGAAIFRVEMLRGAGIGEDAIVNHVHSFVRSLLFSGFTAWSLKKAFAVRQHPGNGSTADVGFIISLLEDFDRSYKDYERNIRRFNPFSSRVARFSDFMGDSVRYFVGVNGQNPEAIKTLREFLESHLSFRQSNRLLLELLPPAAGDGQAIEAYCYTNDDNFGDQILPVLIKQLFGVTVRICSDRPKVDLVSVGSVLEALARTPFEGEVRVWGSGTIGNGLLENDLLSNSALRLDALRGRATLDSVVNARVSDRFALGDPGLLFSLAFPRNPEDYHGKVAIVPHYVDYDIAMRQFGDDERFIVIDVSDEPLSVIKQISGADVVFSSSLHGLITADSYGVPNVWAKFSDNLSGGEHKFFDYYSAFGGEPIRADLSRLKDDEYIEALRASYRPITDLSDIQRRLFDSFPFPDEAALRDFHQRKADDVSFYYVRVGQDILVNTRCATSLFDLKDVDWQAYKLHRQIEGFGGLFMSHNDGVSRYSIQASIGADGQTAAG